MIVFVDTGVLGLLANPNKKGEAANCEQWLLGLLSKGVSVLTSDICDYEVRRNLILESFRKPNTNSVTSLDELKDLITKEIALLPIDALAAKSVNVPGSNPIVNLSSSSMPVG